MPEAAAADLAADDLDQAKDLKVAASEAVERGPKAVKAAADREIVKFRTSKRRFTYLTKSALDASKGHISNKSKMNDLLPSLLEQVVLVRLN